MDNTPSHGVGNPAECSVRLSVDAHFSRSIQSPPLPPAPPTHPHTHTHTYMLAHSLLTTVLGCIDGNYRTSGVILAFSVSSVCVECVHVSCVDVLCVLMCRACTCIAHCVYMCCRCNTCDGRSTREQNEGKERQTTMQNFKTFPR